jgi:hypothetical protein
MFTTVRYLVSKLSSDLMLKESIVFHESTIASVSMNAGLIRECLGNVSAIKHHKKRGEIEILVP